MDLLQRIQRWYTINCNGDWEHEYSVSITTIDNPGWVVKIDLQYTCLQNASLDYALIQRTTTDWVGYSVKDGAFEGMGGAGNLSEILTYFLDTFLPSHLDADCTIEIGLPVIGYEGKLWLNAEGKMVSESTLEITAIEDYDVTGNYLWSNNETLEAVNQPGNIPKELKVDFAVGERVEPTVFQADDNMLRTFLVSPAKK
ncbi:immunity 53 family protein [Hymenobacter sp. DH14]|uniref:Immunity 53 family protein n=1 Tax=Hymenobacter cyanobacteriorum TaxID=2926463 RepID=A0A9X1VFZ1_9BACT|nr:immunity 53 family protein [Hymenobacter cyanobacteriorum]MCI1186110.1 immunity 53 family protein [Hymenobacter cyanobacteriorum]